MFYHRPTALGKTDLSPLPIIFGAWALGGHRWGHLPSESTLIATIRQACDSGITLFDTAAVYGFGRSEELLGKALGKRCPWPYRDAKIATKFGLVWNDKAQISKKANKSVIRRQVEESLRRLNRDSIDLYQLHWPDLTTPLAETIETLQRLQDEGKIKHFGASNLNLRQLKEARRYGGGFATLQPQYSLLERHIESDILPWCQQQGVGILVYSPLAKGLLTGKYGVQLPHFEAADIRAREANFKTAAYAQLYPKLLQFQQLATELGTTPGNLALAWLLHQPGVDAVIVGIKHPYQLQENLQALSLKLSTSTLQQLNQLFPGPAPRSLAPFQATL